MTGGFTMFIKGGKLYYDYNFLDGVHYHLTSPPLPRGKTELKFNFIKTREFGGTGELYVNGQKVDEVDMPQMHIATYSLAETFDIYFGPSAPEGLESNWIQTKPGEGWWSAMRLYGPGAPAFDGTWKLGDIVEAR